MNTDRTNKANQRNSKTHTEPRKDRTITRKKDRTDNRHKKKGGDYNRQTEQKTERANTSQNKQKTQGMDDIQKEH